MSDDWLERQLACDLAPVSAPDSLGIRLGFSPPKHWEFPRLALALAAAVVVIMGGGYAANRTAALDLRQEAVPQLRATETQRPRLVSCDREPPTPQQLNAGRATVLLAHAASDMPAHALAATPEAGCQLCHTL